MTIAKNVSYDPLNVLPVHYIGATDPALDAANGVQAGKVWAETDEDPPTEITAVVGYWIRNLANDTWIAFTVTGAPPTGAAGGSLSGTYPNPAIATDVALPGNPTTTTQAAGNDTTRVATTAFVKAAIDVVLGGVASAFDTLAEIATELGLLDGRLDVLEAIVPAPVKTETASYTLVLADAGKWIRMNVGSANNLTVPLNATVAFPVGTEIHLEQMGAGQTTVVATGGVTIRSPETLLLAKQYAVATLKKVATDEWVLAGYLEV